MIVRSRPLKSQAACPQPTRDQRRAHEDAGPGHVSPSKLGEPFRPGLCAHRGTAGLLRTQAGALPGDARSAGAWSGYGRTPVLQAVNRLAADTLVLVTPRHGLQIAPVDLTRDRVLLRLRRDMERFVIRLATERSGSSQRNQMLHLKRQLAEHRDGMTLEQFNVVDRRIDQLFLAAAGEPFVESTLRPLHTIFRRIGWIYHTHAERRRQPARHGRRAHRASLMRSPHGNVDEAIAASDRLVDFVEGMFEVLEREVEPALLDCRLEALDTSFLEPLTAAASRL